jgi:Peroxidase
MAFLSLLTTYLFLLAASFGMLAKGQLDPHFYDKVCPKALPTIKSIIEDAIKQEARMGASLVRMHFHDCFVNVHKNTYLIHSNYFVFPVSIYYCYLIFWYLLLYISSQYWCQVISEFCVCGL